MPSAGAGAASAAQTQGQVDLTVGLYDRKSGLDARDSETRQLPNHDSPFMIHDSPEFPRHLVIASMTGIVIAMFMAALDATIVGTAMPRLVQDLNGFNQ